MLGTFIEYVHTHFDCIFSKRLLFHLMCKINVFVNECHGHGGASSHVVTEQGYGRRSVLGGLSGTTNLLSCNCPECNLLPESVVWAHHARVKLPQARELFWCRLRSATIAPDIE